MVPNIIVSGPEGCGTTYLWRCLRKQLPIPIERCSPFSKGDTIDSGLHHYSIPSHRPMCWLTDLELIPETKFVFAIRDKKEACNSVRRRFHTANAEYFYDKALETITLLKRDFESLEVDYTALASVESRERIVSFCGGTYIHSKWVDFVHGKG